MMFKFNKLICRYVKSVLLLWKPIKFFINNNYYEKAL